MAFEDVPHTQVRRIIAARLTQSKQTVPHAYVRGTAGTAAVQAARAALAAGGVKVSVNDFVIAAAARALADVPALNVRWDEAAGAPLAVPAIDVAIAVATPGGLITPIVTAAAARSVPDISTAVRDLAARARAAKLAPHEFQGGSFSISNLGMFGVTSFSAIINPPQAAILAVGATVPDPVWPAGAEAVSFVDRLAVTLSFDARAVAAEDAAAWLDAFAAHLESPEGLVAGGGGGGVAAAAA
jgi:pyruvate dehydrogenase E2 component (dihydrolipoamide acetyltransferase)